MQVHPVVDAVRNALRAAANPDKAPEMQAYMKSAMPFFGVQKPERHQLLREQFAAHPIANPVEWRATALTLWREATHREERYAALELLDVAKYRKWADLESLPMLEEMIATGAWWDLVDELAVKRVGPLLRAHQREVGKLARTWSRGGDMWKRRTSIICQIGSKSKTDVELLVACIEPSLGSKEFFLQKAIGWALREHCKTDPEWVATWVRENEGRLAALSRREALRNL